MVASDSLEVKGEFTSEYFLSGKSRLDRIWRLKIDTELLGTSGTVFNSE